MREISCRPRPILDSRPQILLAGLHQSAIGVIDDHKFLGVEQVVRHQQRAQTIVGHNAASVADDVGVPSCQPQSTDGKPRVHASKMASFRAGRGVSLRNSCVRE